MHTSKPLHRVVVPLPICAAKERTRSIHGRWPAQLSTKLLNVPIPIPIPDAASGRASVPLALVRPLLK
jgi:hypothetical protein